MSDGPRQQRRQRRLVLFTRWPAPARCKRRLAVAIGPRRAAAVQERLLRHGLAAARSATRAASGIGGTGGLPGDPIELVLAVCGLGDRARRRWGQTLAVDRIVGQGEGSLGLRLRRQVVRARREGVTELVLIGSDLPQLCGADLLAAFAALRRSPLVLGPARDGGYWLIGLSPQRSAPRLFAGAHAPIPWGRPSVLRSTLEGATAEGLTPILLAERADLDRPSDLAAWR